MQKVIVISGATSGIGLACADMFAENGYKVYCLARKEPANYAHEFIQCDVTSENDIDNAVSQILKKEPIIDVVLCNAGYGISGALENCSLNDVKPQFDVNFFGAFSLAKAFVPKFKEQKHGKILFMSSVGAIFALPFQAMYSASKSALETMAQAWRIELKPFNIQVGCILPGDTKTNFTNARKKLESDATYSERSTRSISRMEHDETHGLTPKKVAKVTFKAVESKYMPVRKIVGTKYKFFAFLDKVVPKHVVLWVVGKLYG